MEVCGKQGFWGGTRSAVKVFQYRLCNRAPVNCTRAPANFIEDYKTSWRHVVENISKFEHLDKKRTLSACEIIKCANAGEYAIKNSDTGVPCRHKTSCLGHYTDKRNRPHVRGLSRHICSGNYHYLRARTGQIGIVSVSYTHLR